MRNFKIGDFVKVTEHDIWGKVVDVTESYVVIDDEDSEWEYPESRLEFRHYEVHLINPED
jgi:RNase P/RNase MRP subunit p29